MQEKFNGNLKAKDEKDLDMGLIHNTGLYDLDEDKSGEKVDLATGKPIDNSSSDPGAQKLYAVNGGKRPKGYNDALPPIKDEDDAAAKFLREYEEQQRKAS
jgi:hypothetical protein